ncbi:MULTISPECIES: TIGR04255 family protein [unclassified Limnobacter]|uniref:TIGR04255 family protein n=1 Tax=unclassified Limnobacter TaxID=2630203 RepID=UPI000C3DBC60|nr:MULTISPECIES: TIGR04255 family protein [unclassified Limnobacter]MAZ09296.1 hypothetical protein [Sutterellaceae bacterium]|tara:strand:- start:1677 stop:2486 length:810 start_codon:yes stop_codon:yes gene_type:complete
MTVKSKIEPIRGRHAIETSVFAFELMEVSEDKIDAFVTKVSEVCNPSTGFTVVNPLNEVEFKVENGKSNIRHRQIGREFVKPSESGGVDWVISVGAKIVSCTCFVYDRWAPVKEFSFSYLERILQSAKTLDVGVNAIALEYQDVFNVRTGDPREATHSLFNLSSSYLPTNLKNFDGLWHVNQGWFQRFDDCHTVLNILNINTQQANDVITARIHGVHRITDNNVLKGVAGFQLDVLSNMNEWFDSLHQQNKETLRNLLSSEATESISLG